MTVPNSRSVTETRSRFSLAVRRVLRAPSNIAAAMTRLKNAAKRLVGGLLSTIRGRPTQAVRSLSNLDPLPPLKALRLQAKNLRPDLTPESMGELKQLHTKFLSGAGSVLDEGDRNRLANACQFGPQAYVGVVEKLLNHHESQRLAWEMQKV